MGALAFIGMRTELLALLEDSGARGAEVATLAGIGWADVAQQTGLDWEREFPSVTLGIFFRLAQVIAAWLIGLLLLALAPERMRRMRRQLERAPGRSALVGLGVLVGFAPAMALLAISLLGIPFIPLAIVLWLSVLVAGLGTVALVIGRTFGAGVSERSPWAALAMGFAVIAVVAIIPILGSIAIGVGACVGAGAVVLSRFGSEGRRARTGHPDGGARDAPHGAAPQGAWRLPPMSETQGKPQRSGRRTMERQNGANHRPQDLMR